MPVAIRTTAVLIAAAFLLAGCSSSAESTGTTLAETKSPVQLLRNELADRIDDAVVSELLIANDKSTACRTPEADPEGLQRSWESTARVELVEGSDPKDVIEDLVGSFVEQGWERGTYGTASIIELTRPGNGSEIHISSKKPNEETGAPGEIQIGVGGPCVMTAGADSDEVRALESAG